MVLLPGRAAGGWRVLPQRVFLRHELYGYGGRRAGGRDGNGNGREGQWCWESGLGELDGGGGPGSGGIAARVVRSTGLYVHNWWVRSRSFCYLA